MYFLQFPLSVISIHVLREEDDRCDWWLCSAYAGFQSTSSARRTTKEECGYTPSYVISIHVLREEDDLLRLLPSLLTLQFQSTSSARRTTQSAKSNRR